MKSDILYQQFKHMYIVSLHNNGMNGYNMEYEFKYWR